jgi:hypothetical protein
LITAVGQLLTRIEATAGGDQQREAGADLLVANANVALLEERHGSPSIVAAAAPIAAGRMPWQTF